MGQTWPPGAWPIELLIWLGSESDPCWFEIRFQFMIRLAFRFGSDVDHNPRHGGRDVQCHGRQLEPILTDVLGAAVRRDH